MKDLGKDKKLETAAKEIVGLIEERLKDLPEVEREARWKAFSEVVDRIRKRSELK